MLVPSIFSNDLFDTFFNDSYTPSERYIHSANTNSLMKTDIKEFEDRYELGIELPGYEKKDVTASLKDGYLIVEAERHEDNELKDKKGRYIRKECFTGKCQRHFYVGEQVTRDDIHASFDNGVLNISVPKIKEQPKVEENKFISIE